MTTNIIHIVNGIPSSCAPMIRARQYHGAPKLGAASCSAKDRVALYCDGVEITYAVTAYGVDDEDDEGGRDQKQRELPELTGTAIVLEKYENRRTT